MDRILAALKGGTVRRLIVFAVGMGITLLNNKIGLGLTEEQQGIIAALVLGYIGQSAAREASVTKAVVTGEANKEIAGTRAVVPPLTHTPVTDDKLLSELRRGPTPGAP